MAPSPPLVCGETQKVKEGMLKSCSQFQDLKSKKINIESQEQEVKYTSPTLEVYPNKVLLSHTPKTLPIQVTQGHHVWIRRPPSRGPCNAVSGLLEWQVLLECRKNSTLFGYNCIWGLVCFTLHSLLWRLIAAVCERSTTDQQLWATAHFRSTMDFALLKQVATYVSSRGLPNPELWNRTHLAGYTIL